MSSPILQLLVLAGIAVFLILRLRNVLGTREGFEKPPLGEQDRTPAQASTFEVIEGGPDHDITDHVDEGSPEERALVQLKAAEPEFNVTDFLAGARGAYEMILMAFERGELTEVEPFVGQEIYESFSEVVEARKQQGLTIEAEFVGVADMKLVGARFDPDTRIAEITVRFNGQLTQVVRDTAGNIVDGEPGKVKTQKDVWTFERRVGTDDLNWILVETGG